MWMMGSSDLTHFLGLIVILWKTHIRHTIGEFCVQRSHLKFLTIHHTCGTD